MDQADFIRRISELSGKLAWFLGAGASQSAGLPTAIDIIWNLRRRYYCSEEQQDISSNDLQNPAVKTKIDAYMLSRGFPEASDPSAYSRTFELIFGDDYERQRRHLQATLSEKNSALTQGHRVFSALMAIGAIKAVFTTNFDTVVERALAEISGKAVAPFHLEGSYAANEAINNEDYPFYCKLHGDFRYQSLKNLSDDLLAQNAELGRAFLNAASRFGFVVVGYSGRDDSVMRLFDDVLKGHNPFPHGLYWTGLKGRQPLLAVTKLIEAAKLKGVTAEYVEIETFDALMSRIWMQVQDKPHDLDSKIGRKGTQSVIIPLTEAGTGSFLRLNALPVLKLPEKCLELSFSHDVSWKEMRAAERQVRGKLICTKGQGVWAWGSQDAAKSAFGASLTAIKTVSLIERFSDLQNNQHLKGFAERGIGQALCRGKPLLHRDTRSGSVLIFDRKGSPAPNQISSCVEGLYGEVQGVMTIPTTDHPKSEIIYWAEALRLNFEEINGAYWLVLNPEIWIWPKFARKQAIDFIDKRTSDRFNSKADKLLSAWLSLLFPVAARASDQVVQPFDGQEDGGHPIFTINIRTAFSRRSIK